MTRASGSVVDTRASRRAFSGLPGFDRLDRGQLRQGLFDARQPIGRRTALRGLGSGRRRLRLPVRPLDLLARLPLTRLQRLAAAKRAGAGTAADPRAIVGDARHASQSRDAASGDRLRQQIIERRLVRHPKIAQRVVIHRHAAAQPAIRIMAITEAIHFARAADAVHRGVQPQRDQNLRIDRRPAGPPSRARIAA